MSNRKHPEATTSRVSLDASHPPELRWWFLLTVLGQHLLLPPHSPFLTGVHSCYYSTHCKIPSVPTPFPSRHLVIPLCSQQNWKKTVHIPCPSYHPSKDASTHISAPVHGNYLCQVHQRPQNPIIVPWSWLHRTYQRHLVQLSSLNIFLHVPLGMPHSPGITTVFLPISSLLFCMFLLISLSF